MFAIVYCTVINIISPSTPSTHLVFFSSFFPKKDFIKFISTSLNYSYVYYLYCCIENNYFYFFLFFYLYFFSIIDDILYLYIINNQYLSI